MFIPHEADMKITEINPTPKEKYKVRIAPLAYKKMQFYVENVDNEVGWLGTAFNNEPGVITIEDVFMFKQEVNGGTCEITAQGLTDFAMELLAKPDGADTYNALRMWGHSHNNMQTFASAQDDKQMEVFANNGQPWMLRIIANKKGSITMTLYDYQRNKKIYDVPWEIAIDAPEGLEEQIKAEIAEKVSVLTYATPSKVTQIGFGNDYHRVYGRYDEYDEYDDYPDPYGRIAYSRGAHKGQAKTAYESYMETKAKDIDEEDPIEALAEWLQVTSAATLFELTKLKDAFEVETFLENTADEWAVEYYEMEDLFDFVQDNEQIIVKALNEEVHEDPNMQNYMISDEHRAALQAVRQLRKEIAEEMEEEKDGK